MRRHANFVEYVPLILILIALLELNEVDETVIHVMGATLVGVRASHAWGMQPDDARGIFRFIGAVGTTLLLVVSSTGRLRSSDRTDCPRQMMPPAAEAYAKVAGGKRLGDTLVAASVPLLPHLPRS
jgi:hypothetical protein